MSELLRELEDDIRRDRFAAIWKKHAGFIIGACVAVVIGTTGGVIWKQYRAGVDESLTTKLVVASALTDKAKRDELYQSLMTEAGSHSQGALAGLRLAADQAEAGDKKAALATYEKIAEGNYDWSLRNLALAHAAHASISLGKKTTIGEATASRGAPYYDTLREAEAWQLLKSGEKEKAKERFAGLAEDVNTPPALRARMETVSSYLQAQGAEE